MRAHSSVIPYPFGRLFSWPWVISSHSYAYQYSVELLRPFCISLEFSMQISSLLNSGLGTLAILVFLDSQLCLFNSGSSPGSSWVFPFLHLRPESFSRLTVSWGSCWTYFIYFPYFIYFSEVTVLYCLIYSVLEIIISYALSIFWLVQAEG